MRFGGRPGAAVALACLAAGAVRRPAIPWRADERVLVTDASSVTALARSPTTLYAATGGGLLLYDDVFERFDLPITVEDGYPSAEVSALAWDARDGTLWVAAGRQLLQWDPRAERFVDRIPLSAPVHEIVPGGPGGSGLLLRSGNRWRSLDPFTRSRRAASASEATAAIERIPDLRTRRELLVSPQFADAVPFLSRGTGRRDVRVRDVMPAYRPGTYWVATDGGFLLRFRPATFEWTAVPFGFRGRGSAAVVEGPGGIWFAPRSFRNGAFGVARSDAGLQRWDVWASDSALSVPGPELRATASTGGTVWMGGEEGLFRYDEADGEWGKVDDPVLDRSLPVLALATDRRSEERFLWVGSARGLLRLREGRAPVEAMFLDGIPVRTVYAGGRGVWAGGDEGLFRAEMTDRGEVLRIAPVGGGPLALRRPVWALAGRGDTLYAGLGDEVWVRDAAGEWGRVEAIGSMGSRVTALAVADEGVLWAGGDEGVVAWNPRGPVLRRLSFAGGDLPLDDAGRRGVWAIAPDGENRAWISTPAGALRLDLDW